MTDTTITSDRPRRGVVSHHTHPQRSTWKRFYVATLMLLLPLLLKLACLFSKKVRQESKYLGEGFTFALVITGSPQKKYFKRTAHSWRSFRPATSVDLTITFRDLDYAYDVFSGTTSLKDALGARLFTTHGPNDKGVSVTYLFTIILKTFFGWRSAYRR